MNEEIEACRKALIDYIQPELQLALKVDYINDQLLKLIYISLNNINPSAIDLPDLTKLIFAATKLTEASNSGKNKLSEFEQVLEKLSTHEGLKGKGLSEETAAAIRQKILGVSNRDEVQPQSDNQKSKRVGISDETVKEIEKKIFGMHDSGIPENN